MIAFLKRLLARRTPIECDHIFYPHYDNVSKHPIGQLCILCDKFNSNEEIGITYDLDELKRKHGINKDWTKIKK
tara:strand:- start:230 stop:451 length:222 start_codon:yes stop_codon:yes gene_type:complete